MREGAVLKYNSVCESINRKTRNRLPKVLSLSRNSLIISEFFGGIFDNSQHVHNAGEDHHLCLPFDQLLGGGPNGNGRNPVYGLASFPV
mgnify:CR=1 FL=1